MVSWTSDRVPIMIRIYFQDITLSYENDCSHGKHDYGMHKVNNKDKRPKDIIIFKMMKQAYNEVRILCINK